MVRDAPAETLRLDLVDMKVRSVRVSGRDVIPRQDAEHLDIPIEGGRTGDTLIVAIEYGGIPADGLVISTDSAGRWRYFGDNWPNRARHWIPSFDHPSSKATVTWIVTAPSSLSIVANGALVREAPAPGNPSHIVSEWREARPIPAYLMVIAAAPLVTLDLGQTACGLSEFGGCVPQQAYSTTDGATVLPGGFAQAGDIVAYFARTVGPFPYEKLAHVQSSTRFGGMENASEIFYPDNAYRRSGPSVTTIAHETAHQWFGDAVTEATWPHAWLSEGFAVYFSALYLGHAYGDSAMMRLMHENRVKVLQSPVVAERPVIDTIETNLMALLNVNSYEKGGWVLHMLRQEIGDSAFFGGIRDYYAEHRHGTASTDDLMHDMEKRASRPLGWFFDEWLRRPGFPSFTAHWSYDAQRQTITIDVEQQPRFGFFQLKLPVVVRQSNGVMRIEHVQVNAEHTGRIVIGNVAAAPQAVELDPDGTLLAVVESKRSQ